MSKSSSFHRCPAPPSLDGRPEEVEEAEVVVGGWKIASSEVTVGLAVAPVAVATVFEEADFVEVAELEPRAG